MVIGIGLAEWADMVWMLAAASMVSLVGIFFHRPWWLYVLGAIIAGFIYWSLMHPVCPAGFNDDQPVESVLQVMDDPAVKEGQTRFTACEQSTGYRYRVACRFVTNPEKGDLVKACGTARRIEGPSNPGEFDFQEYFAHRDIFYNLIIDQACDIERVGKKQNLVQSLCKGIVKRGVYSINQNMEPKEAVLLIGMLFGFQGEISAEDFSLFQKTGLVHIFSVSGFHVGFIVLLGTYLAGFLNLSKRDRLLFVAGLILVYGFLAAWPVPLVRAAIMTWMGLLAVYLGRERDLLTSLAAAGLVILIINPANLFEISFQLTFLATWGIIYLYPRWKEGLRSPAKWKDILILSLAPQVAVLPLASYYYNMVSIISVAANFLLVNLAGGAVILGFIGVIVAQINQAAAGLLMIPAGLITRIVILGVDLLARVPGGYLWVAKPEIGLVAAAYGGLIILCRKPKVNESEDLEPDTDETVMDHPPRKQLVLIDKWPKFIGYTLIAVFIGRLLLPGQWKDPGRLKVVFLDVGQGDCIYIKTARGSTILIDGGGSLFYDVGSKVVLPYLRREGVRQLDLAIATHPHVDHVQGLQKVLAECPAAVILGGQYCIEDKPVTRVHGLNRLLLDDDSKLWVWAPDAALDKATAESSAGNDVSVVTKISMGKVSFLFTGDAAKNELEELDRTGADLASTVVKVPHHGSKYSWYDPFWDRQDPIYAVISVGAHNTFGHPNPTVVQRLRQKGIKVLRTDINSAVTFRTDGQDLEVQTMQ